MKTTIKNGKLYLPVEIGLFGKVYIFPVSNNTLKLYTEEQYQHFTNKLMKLENDLKSKIVIRNFYMHTVVSNVIDNIVELPESIIQQTDLNGNVNIQCADECITITSNC